MTWHNTPLDPPGLRRRLAAGAQSLVARRADINLAASADLAASVRRSRRARCPRRTGGGLAAGGDARRAVGPRELGLADGQQLVLTVGRLHPQKGLDVLVAAAARWPAAQVAVDRRRRAASKQHWRRRSRRRGAPVRLLGRRTDVADLLAAADLVVLPSRWEARSLAAQEALLAGRPLVATAVGGLPDLLGDGAVLIAADDVDALDAAVWACSPIPCGGRRWRLEAPSGPDLADRSRHPGPGQAVYTELLGLD